VAGLGTLNVAAQTPAGTTAADYDDPLNLFAEMMPVIRSPRCANCHGGTDPNVKPEGLNHPGGQLDIATEDGVMLRSANLPCLECHTAPGATPDWRLAPTSMSFIGKDALKMCRQLRSDNLLASPANRTRFMTHLEEDPLVRLAFVGQGGIGEESASAPEPPPMSHAEFLAAARRWVTDGEAGCRNEWSGEIMQISTMARKEKFAPAAGGREVGADTTIKITVDKNRATAEVHWDMHDFTDVPARDCATYVHHSYSAVDYKLPIVLTIALNPPKRPAGGPPELPPGFTLPGYELPPGFPVPPEMILPPGATLPPGMVMPPGMVLPPGVDAPPAVGTPFFTFATADNTEVIGKHRSDVRSLPGCQPVIVEKVHRYHVEGAMVEVTVDPDNPNRTAGEKLGTIPGGRSVIRWDLTRHLD
jgi:hypothetical protein